MADSRNPTEDEIRVSKVAREKARITRERGTPSLGDPTAPRDDPDAQMPPSLGDPGSADRAKREQSK
jgi:hypothetical protein